LVPFKLDFFGSSILSDLGLVQLVLYIILLLSVALEARAQFSLDKLTFLRFVGLRHRVDHLELFDISIFIFAEPVIENTDWHILVISSRLESAIL